MLTRAEVRLTREITQALTHAASVAVSAREVHAGATPIWPTSVYSMPLIVKVIDWVASRAHVVANASTLRALLVWPIAAALLLFSTLEVSRPLANAVGDSALVTIRGAASTSSGTGSTQPAITRTPTRT